MTEPNVLLEADGLIHGPRNAAYDHPLTNFGRIVALWNAYLAERLSAPLTEEDHAVMMILVKAARLLATPDHRDSIVDIAGYAGVIEMIQDERTRQAFLDTRTAVFNGS